MASDFNGGRVGDDIKTILLVDDDQALRDLIADFLNGNGYVVLTAGDATTANRLLTGGRIDLVILDVMMPGEDGLSLCRRLRGTSQCPIIMLSAAGADVDRIVGLEVGADDYLAKPCNPRELLARVRALLRRAGYAGGSPEPASSAASAYHFAGWRMVLPRKELYAPDGIAVPLTGGEFALMKVFVENPNRILTRDELLSLVRGRASFAYDRVIDVQVSRLRRRLAFGENGEGLIRTVRSEGYFFWPEVERL